MIKQTKCIYLRQEYVLTFKKKCVTNPNPKKCNYWVNLKENLAHIFRRDYFDLQFMNTENDPFLCPTLQIWIRCKILLVTIGLFRRMGTGRLRRACLVGLGLLIMFAGLLLLIYPKPDLSKEQVKPNIAVVSRKSSLNFCMLIN